MKGLETQLRKSAKDICAKYINPPRTTDFALMFLPTEGLYAEAIRRVGLVEQVQRDCRVVFAGPTTLAALLNSLQMGFRTLAIQKRSSEVWNLLAGVKTEFGKFGEALSSVKDKLDQAARKMEDVDVRSRAITKKLRDVEELPDESAAAVAGVIVGATRMSRFVCEVWRKRSSMTPPLTSLQALRRRPTALRPTSLCP